MARSSADAAARPPIESHVHDAVDLATGRVVSRPHRVGLGDVNVFGTPSHRLTPRTPYQASPEGYIDAFDGTYSAGNDTIWWRVPATFDNFHATCNATFLGVAAGPRVLSVNVEVWPYTGRTGHIVIFVGQTEVAIPVSTPTARTIDVSFTHDDSDVFTAMIVLQQGIIDFVVHSITLGSPGIVVTGEQPTA
jgi:hypothetical protein